MSIEISPQAYLFYKHGGLVFDSIQGHAGIALNAHIETDAIHGPLGFTNNLAHRVGENVTKLYDSILVEKATVDGTTYSVELGILENPSGDGVTVHDATYSSSLVANHGNGFERARDFSLGDTTYVYMGAPGIGLSSGYTPAEQRYLKKYGTLLVPDPSYGKVKALPIVEARAKVLHDLGLVPTDLRSDSAGALMSVAREAAFGNGNIRTSRQNVRPGIKDIGALSLAFGMLYLDGRVSKQHAVVSPDELKMSKEMLAFTDRHISDGFKARGLEPKKDSATLLANLIGLGRGPAHDDPLVNDNIALVRANPDARILFTLGERDPLTRRSDLEERLADVVSAISRYTSSSVNAVVFEGLSHNVQTHYPQYLNEVSKFILGR